MNNYKKEIIGCGIVGSHNIDISDQEFCGMINCLAHRGPDAEGFWKSEDGLTLLGHRRLSIIGIDHRGDQPFEIHSMKLAITFNGEIYNYPELRKELESYGYLFTSDTDTEVILYAYHKWYTDCFHRFNGIFSFCLFDGVRNQIMLARDHVGVKPLIYADIGKAGIIFASEAKSILNYSQFSTNPNMESIKSTWIHHLWQNNSNTWFDGIQSLECGAYLIINRSSGDRQKEYYWEITPQALYGRKNLGYLHDEFRYLLCDSIKQQVRSDVGICCTLSGGLDSSALAILAAEKYKDYLDAFSIRYINDNVIPMTKRSPDFLGKYSRSSVDLWYARKLSSEYEGIHLHEVVIDENNFCQDTVDQLVYSLEQMPFDTRMLSIYRLYENIKHYNHKVALIGQGPDEIWLGYYYDDDFWRFPPEKVSDVYLWSEYFPNQLPFDWSCWNPNFMNREIAQSVSKNNIESIMHSFHSGDPLNDLAYLGFHTILQTILLLEDRLSMRHSIEARVPWLDFRIVELAFRVPSFLKIDSGDDNKAKYFNREALKSILPTYIYNRRKSPLPHPPKKYKAYIIASLIQPNLSQMIRSELLGAIFSKNFIENICTSDISHNQLFKIFSLWRFEKLFL